MCGEVNRTDRIRTQLLYLKVFAASLQYVHILHCNTSRWNLLALDLHNKPVFIGFLERV